MTLIILSNRSSPLKYCLLLEFIQADSLLMLEAAIIIFVTSFAYQRTHDAHGKEVF